MLNLDSQVTFNTPETVREVLMKKHPPGKPPTQSAVVTVDNSVGEPHPVLSDRSDGDLIQITALKQREPQDHQVLMQQLGDVCVRCSSQAYPNYVMLQQLLEKEFVPHILIHQV